MIELPTNNEALIYYLWLIRGKCDSYDRLSRYIDKLLKQNETTELNDLQTLEILKEVQRLEEI